MLFYSLNALHLQLDNHLLIFGRRLQVAAGHMGILGEHHIAVALADLHEIAVAAVHALILFCVEFAFLCQCVHRCPAHGLTTLDDILNIQIFTVSLQQLAFGSLGRALLHQNLVASGQGHSSRLHALKRIYTLVPVYDEDMDITPQLQAKIDQARQEYKEGRTLRFESAEEVQKWMDEL